MRLIRSSSDLDKGGDDDDSPSSPLSTPDVFGVAGADGSASMAVHVAVFGEGSLRLRTHAKRLHFLDDR